MLTKMWKTGTQPTLLTGMENGAATVRVAVQKGCPDLPGGPTVLPGVYPRQLKTLTHTKTCTWVFTATSFIPDKSGNNSNVHQRMVDKHNVCHPRRGVLLSHERSEVLTRTTTRMILENVLSERSQA